FENFFKKRANFPKFKSKYSRQSLTYPQGFKIGGDRIKFPKLGVIPAVIHRPIKGKVKSVTISKDCSGEYFASILVEDGVEIPEPNPEGKAIGLDMGLTHFCTDSDGNKTDNPRWFKKHERNLRVKQQRLSRRKKGSSNRNKARLKVAKVQGKIARCRKDFHQKLSRSIVDKNQVIAVENLNIKGMVKNRKLSKAISQVGWSDFCTMLKYKAERLGKVYIEVNRFYPSSKTCNVCLNKVDILPLDIRTWVCTGCNTQHDRDVNAARNIRDEALRIITSGTGVQAYCLDVSPETGNSNGHSIG
ncbi:MAG: RNA-guided endonuclease InsQ/TnpB family protein, partial [Waterburya sp.]